MPVASKGDSTHYDFANSAPMNLLHSTFVFNPISWHIQLWLSALSSSLSTCGLKIHLFYQQSLVKKTNAIKYYIILI